jgi:hypothetical protein
VDLANPRSLKPHYKERILKQALYAWRAGQSKHRRSVLRN